MSRKNSYTYLQEKRTFFKRVQGWLKILVIIFLVYQLVFNFFISKYTVSSISMEPTVKEGQVILASPLINGPYIPVIQQNMGPLSLPERGTLVLVRPSYYNPPPWYIEFLNGFVGFFTLNYVNLETDFLNQNENALMLKRIIGIPGDTIYIQGYTAYIKTAESQDFLPEYQFYSDNLSIDNTSSLPEQWTNDLPFNSDYDPIELKEGEYFILGDNRAFSQDSRYFGPVKEENIMATVLIRIWPLENFGGIE